MKLNQVIIFSIVLLMPFFAAAEDTPWKMKLPFKEAVVTYELSGMESGQEKLYIKDYGQRTARHRTISTTVLGITQTASSVEIMTPEWIYTFNVQEGTGTQSVNPQKLMIKEYRELSSEERKRVDINAEKMAGALMGGLQGSVEPDAREILGYSCDRTTSMGTTVYSIHNSGITLLSESNIMGIIINSTAIAIDTQGAEDSYFEFPEGIVPRSSPEKDQMAAMIARQTISILKDPEHYKVRNQGLMGMPAAGQPAIPEEDKRQMQEAMKTIKELFGN